MFSWALVRIEPSERGSFRALLPWGASRLSPEFCRNMVPAPGSPEQKDRLGTPHPWTVCQSAGTAASGLHSPASNTWRHSLWIRAHPLLRAPGTVWPWPQTCCPPSSVCWALGAKRGSECEQAAGSGGAKDCPKCSSSPGGRRHQESKYVPGRGEGATAIRAGIMSTACCCSHGICFVCSPSLIYIYIYILARSQGELFAGTPVSRCKETVCILSGLRISPLKIQVKVVQNSFPPSEITLYAVGGLCSCKAWSWISIATAYLTMEMLWSSKARENWTHFWLKSWVFLRRPLSLVLSKQHEFTI